MFWSLFKKLKKKPTIPSLSHNGSLPLSKANMINTFFSLCLNTSVAPLSPHSHLDFSVGDCPNELLCEVKSIVDLLKVPSDTSSGPDGISACMLLATGYSISLPLVTFLMFGKLLMSSQFPNKILLILLLLVIAQYHFSLLSVRFLNVTFSIGFSIFVKLTILFLPFN